MAGERKINKDDNKEACYEIIVDYRCNAGCVFCSQDSGLRGNNLSFSFDDIAQRIIAAKKMGYPRIGFTGGEPLLRKDIVDIVAFAKKCGFESIRIQTNGLLLANRNFVKKLVRAGATYFKISIESHIPAVHDILSGARGGLKKIIKGIDALNDLAVRIGINIVVTKKNFMRLAEQVEYFTKEKKITNYVIIYPVYTGNMLNNKEELAVSYSELKPELRKVILFFERYNLQEDFLFLNIPPCVSPKDGGNIANRVIGLEKYDTIVDAPLGKHDLDENRGGLNKKVVECARCLYKVKCPGVNIRYLEMFGSEEIVAISGRSSKERGGNHKRRNLVSDKATIILNSRERCFMEILSRKNNISSEKLLDIAKTIPLCNICNDGVQVINTGRGLVKKHLVKKELHGRVYYWRLIK